MDSAEATEAYWNIIEPELPDDLPPEVLACGKTCLGLVIEKNAPLLDVPATPESCLALIRGMLVTVRDNALLQRLLEATPEGDDLEGDRLALAEARDELPDLIAKFDSGEDNPREEIIEALDGLDGELGDAYKAGTLTVDAFFRYGLVHF